MIHKIFMRDLLEDGRKITVADSAFLRDHIQRKTAVGIVLFDHPARLLDQLLAAGYWPVVAHPERYYGLQRMPNYLYDWVNRGVVLQVNKGSLFGRFGRGAQALAGAMLTHGLVGCIASDAHRPDVRTPELLSAWDDLAEHFSERLSEQLLTRNPELILRSEPLPAGRFRPFF